MRRGLPGGYELDDDPARVDVAEVHRFLSEESYWAKGRPPEVVERVVHEASRVVGLYAGERQLGFGRVVSDGVAFAYMADVYVHPDVRGRGLGVELVRELVENGPHGDVGWLLHTDDAHGLYAHFGFAEPTEKVLERRKGARAI
ncbi:MAG: GNAT family N-acetyltransferase [Gaiellaceae bacterium]